MPPATPRHVIFDLDGTLLDSEDVYTDATQRVVGRFGKRYTWELKKRCMGGDSLKNARIVVETLELPLTPEAFLEEREVHMLTLIPGIQEIAAAGAFVDALAARAVPMALATSSHRPICEVKLQGRAFTQHLRVVVCGDDPRLQRGKPAPDIFLLAAQELGAAPADCVVFEDSVHGLHGALAAGMRAIAVVNPRYDQDPADFAGAEQIIPDFRGLDPDLV